VPADAAREYADACDTNALELSQIYDLTKDELKEINVKLGHQMKILKAIEQLKGTGFVPK